MKQRIKRWIFGLLGKDPEAVVVTFATGDRELCRRMAEEVRRLLPNRRHFVATGENWPELRQELRKYRVGLAPVMLGREPNRLRQAAYWLAPRKILAYNSRLERHHLRLDLASFLFWRGVPLDRIYLRPWWWPWPKRERSTAPSGRTVIDGRPCAAGRRRVAVLSPYLPYPLSHGGAVRIYNLLREMAKEFDVELFAFRAAREAGDAGPLAEICARIVLVDQPRYREPRWSTWKPPEVHEFESPAMRQAIAEERHTFGFEVLQVEYTALAEYGGDVLVEHDVTFDLFEQIACRERTLAARWDAFRWRWFEEHALRRYRRAVVMSKKDAELVGAVARTVIIENGVDLDRFRPEPECEGQRLLFIGSFRHFPNVAAFRWFTEEVWPRLRERFPEMTLTVVAGPDHLTYWRAFSETPEPPADSRIRVLGFVAEVRPLYVEANIVLVPTPVSAGTNLKVLEAMAMERAVVSTTPGCAGLGLVDGESVRIGDTPEAFAAAVAELAGAAERRQRIARAAREHAERHFGWEAIGAKEWSLLRSLIK